METINITRLARLFNSTTKETEKKLSRIGLLPVNEIEMPSGRRFVIFDKQASMKALQALKDEKEPPVRMAPRESTDVERLTKEIAELKTLLASVLEVVTAPKKEH